MSEREFLLQLSDEEASALVEVMFLAAESDGEVQAEELKELAGHVERVTNGRVTRDKAQHIVERASAALSASDRATRLAHVKEALTPAQRRHALLLSIQVTASDGIIRTSERELILETAEALEIDGETAADLVSAVSKSL